MTYLNNLNCNIGLVLEGGGMRGLYTSGILDFFLDKKITFPYVIGVSAGAIMSASYISGQKGRNLETQLKYMNDKRYMGFRHLLKTGSYINNDFSYKKIPNELVPFDFKAFFENETEFKIGMFDCVEGKSQFISKSEIEDNKELMKVLQASGSLPFISRKVVINNKKYLDGGLISPVPLQQSIDDGNKRNVVILTREQEYRKSAPKFKKITKLFYKKYPLVIKALNERYKIYNDSLDRIEKMEKNGEVFVIRPRNKVDCGRLEKDTGKLAKLYFDALKDADYYYDDLKKWFVGDSC